MTTTTENHPVDTALIATSFIAILKASINGRKVADVQQF